MGWEGPARPPRVPRGLARLGFPTAAPAGGSGLWWSWPRGLGRCRVGEGGQLESPAEFRDSPFFSPKPGAVPGGHRSLQALGSGGVSHPHGGCWDEAASAWDPGVGGGTQPPRCEEHRSQAGVSEAPWRGEVGLDRGPSGSPIPTWQMLGHPHPITAQSWPVSKAWDVCVQSSLSMDQAVWGSSKTAL